MRRSVDQAKYHLSFGVQFLKTEADWISSTLYVIPYIAYFSADVQLARQAISLFGWIENWNKTKGHVQPPVYQAEFDRYLNQAREGLSESEFNAAWAEGKSMSREQILALAKEVLQ